jgi:hypothetical protein
MRPYYQKATPNFNPAGVGNSSAKVIEPYFNYLNKTRCRIYDNWSGFNTNTGSKNQPNAEVMNKLKKNFPTREGLEAQIIYIMNQERQSKVKEYVASYGNTQTEFRHIMSEETFLLNLGHTTELNTLRGDGLRVTIDGQYRWFDSFDMNFRKHSTEKWAVHYLEADLNKSLAVAENGQYRFPVIEKYVGSMALADRTDEDEIQRKNIGDFNRKTTKYIQATRQESAELVETLFATNPQLNDVTAKLLLTDSQGHHKIHKRKESKAVTAGTKKVIAVEAKEERVAERNSQAKHLEYLKSKVNVNDYLED